MVMLNDLTFVPRDRLVGELHYACKGISDEAFEYVLAVARSFSFGESVQVGDRMINQTRCILTGVGEAKLSITWCFDGKLFLSSTYTREVSGKWSSDKAMPGYAWAIKIEERYQQKLKEIEAAILQES